eukprot:7036461-Prymnesium_polylepis.1
MSCAPPAWSTWSTPNAPCRHISNRGHQIAAPCDRAAARVDAPSQDIRVRGGEMTRALLSALLRYHEAALRART